MTDETDDEAKGANPRRPEAKKKKRDSGPKFTAQARALIADTWGPMDADTDIPAREVLRRAMLANHELASRWADAGHRLRELPVTEGQRIMRFIEMNYVFETALAYQERAADQAVRLLPYEESKLPPLPAKSAGDKHMIPVHPADEAAEALAETMERIAIHLRGGG